MSRRKSDLMRKMHGLMFKLPTMIQCDMFEDFILDYLEGELPTRQKFVFEMHLKLCRECRDYLKAYRISLNLAKRSLKDDAASVLQEVPEELIAAVLEARRS